MQLHFFAGRRSQPLSSTPQKMCYRSTEPFSLIQNQMFGCVFKCFKLFLIRSKYIWKLISIKMFCPENVKKKPSLLKFFLGSLSPPNNSAKSAQICGRCWLSQLQFLVIKEVSRKFHPAVEAGADLVLLREAAGEEDLVWFLHLAIGSRHVGHWMDHWETWSRPVEVVWVLPTRCDCNLGQFMYFQAGQHGIFNLTLDHCFQTGVIVPPELNKHLLASVPMSQSWAFPHSLMPASLPFLLLFVPLPWSPLLVGSLIFSSPSLMSTAELQLIKDVNDAGEREEGKGGCY